MQKGGRQSGQVKGVGGLVTAQVFHPDRFQFNQRLHDRQALVPAVEPPGQADATSGGEPAGRTAPD